MWVWVAIRLAFAALARQKSRSLLTSLGVLIGVAAVAIVIALGQGARSKVGDQIQSLGSNLVYVFSNSRRHSGARSAAGSRAVLTDDDAAAVAAEIPGVELATVYSNVKMQVASVYFNDSVDVVGADGNYFSARAYSLMDGRYWTAQEESSKAKVCVLGTSAATSLFGPHDPIGNIVRIGRHAYRVIGVLDPKGASPFGHDQDDRIIIPIGSWRSRVSPTPGRRVELVMASLTDDVDAATVVKDIEALLAQRHNVPRRELPFAVRSQDQFRETQERIQGVLSMLLLSVAGIALFVGGVGVMNIMLVNINERQREIGVRMAIGARSGDIQVQFLAEALAVTLLGGILGVLVAFGVTQYLSVSLGWPMQLSFAGVGIGLATSAVVGVIFGFLPARRAASLDPIEALRHE